ncbi:TPA: glycosyl hydrolase family 25, partial [Streptococcus suis]
MRKRIKPIIVVVFFALFTSLILLTRTMAIQAEKRAVAIQEAQIEKEAQKITSASSTYVIENALEMKPIIDVSAWQRPEDIDYDTLSEQISGAIIRIQSGSHTKKENSATDKNGIDKSYKQHIEEFQKRGVPIAVYAYVTGNSIEAMKKEAQSF